jgi:septin family protein
MVHDIRIWFHYIYTQEKIVSELNANGVKVYQFPADDDSVAEINTSMNAHLPFAVVGSSEFVRVGNKNMRARQYPWGTVQGKTLIFTSIVNIILV